MNKAVDFSGTVVSALVLLSRYSEFACLGDRFWGFGFSAEIAFQTVLNYGIKKINL